jgi:type IV pilus assembly protein PilM
MLIKQEFVMKRRQTRLLGVDISDTHARWVALGSLKSGYQLEDYAIQTLRSGSFSTDRVLEIQAFFEPIQSKNTRAVIAMPDASVMRKVIQLDVSFTASEIENLIALEAERYIPYPKNEVSLDFSILGPCSRDPRQQDVLIVATRTSDLQDKVNAVKSAGLSVGLVDVESFALARACSAMSSENVTTAIVDVDTGVLRVHVISEQQILFSETEILINTLFEKESASHHTKDFTLLHLRRVFQKFFSLHDEQKIQKIILTGDLSGLNSWVDAIQDQFEIATLLADPFSKMDMAPSVKKNELKQTAHQLMLSCGLAMRACL